MKDVHNRMPLILKPEVFDEWLDPHNKDFGGIEEILKNGGVRDLKRHPISKRVNNVGYTSKECIEPLKGAGV